VKYLILPVVFFISIFKVSAQTVSVLNARTNEPVEGVLVVAESNYTTQTNVKGGVNLGLIQQDETILFQHASFLNFSATKQQIAENGNVVILVEDPVRLDEVVISVNRWEQSKTEVPRKIEILNAEDVMRISPQTTADLLGAKNGVYIQKSQMGGGSPMIRGFAANRVLLVVDGIRMNNAIFRSGNLHNVISLDANSLENTEIIFGPGSVIYGSDALGGVMSFNTLKPRLSTKRNTEINGKTFVRYSSANFEKTLHGSLNFGSKKWAALVSSTYTDFDDLRMGSNGPDEYLRQEYVASGKFDGADKIFQNDNDLIQKFTGYNQFNLLTKFRYRPGDELDVTLSALHSQTSDIPRYDRLIAYRNDKLRYGNWYYGPQKWTLVSGNVEYQKAHLLFDKANLLAGYQNYEESRHDRNLNDENLRHRTEKLDVFSLNFDLGKMIDTRNDIFYGAEVFYNKVGSSGFSENLIEAVSERIAPRYPDNSTYKSFAAYTSYKLKLSSRLIFQAGTRFTQTMLSGDFDASYYDFPFSEFNMKNSALNGNVGVVWHPTSNWQVNLNVSTGFRSPNIDDVAKVFDSEPGNVIVPNPALEPEYARNLELGIVRSYAGKARFEITGFYTQLKNAMVRRNFSLNGQDSIIYDGVLSNVEALVNAESAKIAGGSFSFRYLFSSSFRTQHNITVINGEDADRFPLRHVPPAFGSSRLVFDKNKWFIDFYLDYSGGFTFNQLPPSEQDKPHLYATDENGKPWSPPWWTLNIKSNYRVNNYFSLNGGIENLFDKRYRTYSSGIVAPGINFKLSAVLKF
jgi:hemoglobin/transferrin/lactoferrin receptor protein